MKHGARVRTHLKCVLQLPERKRQVATLGEELAPLDDVRLEQGLLLALGQHPALGLLDERDDVLLEAVVDLGRTLVIPQAHQMYRVEQLLPLGVRDRFLLEQLQHDRPHLGPFLLERWLVGLWERLDISFLKI